LKAKKNKQLLTIRKEIEKMASKFPLFTWK